MVGFSAMNVEKPTESEILGYLNGFVESDRTM